MDEKTKRSAAALRPVIDGLASLHNDSTFSDFTIVCRDRSWRVHRVFLSFHSSVLAKACKSGFQEAAEQKINLSEDDPHCIDALVFYFYKLEYAKPPSGFSPLYFHVQMCILADKYDVAALKGMACKHFGVEAKEKCTTAEFAEAASLAYEVDGPTEAIRNVIVSLAVEQCLLVTQSAEPSGFEAAMRSNAELAIDIAKASQIALKLRNVGVTVEHVVALGDGVGHRNEESGSDLGFALFD
ncbi:hypothetical protein LTR85_001848 [Meristemomyces frigidus]|nr:hypothetical protein LTR85_001848 [Meristemomyces frigidus]